MHSNGKPSLKIRLHFVVFHFIEPSESFDCVFPHEFLEVNLYESCKITYVRLLVTSVILIPELTLDIL